MSSRRPWVTPRWPKRSRSPAENPRLPGSRKLFCETGRGRQTGTPRPWASGGTYIGHSPTSPVATFGLRPLRQAGGLRRAAACAEGALLRINNAAHGAQYSTQWSQGASEAYLGTAGHSTSLHSPIIEEHSKADLHLTEVRLGALGLLLLIVGKLEHRH